MNNWKASFFVTLTLLVGSNLFWLYSAIDAGITYTYQQVSLDDLNDAHSFLGDLVVKGGDAGITYTYQQVSLDDLNDAHSFLGDLVVKGGKDYSQKDILHLVRQSYPNAFIVEDGNKIIVNNVTFIFEGGKLSKVY
ncbi:hypothetical protein BZG76_08705 [Salinivibrio sp. AR647]|uniref:hypothetical protein n=1 Tax=Salinivibrio sp. AR647 TaxID=1909438 RepID=UPI0009854001|nr:hypothetical protein [Salinivibrio sp. AR647]OOE91919.1 hypothetical protein BZG76_08705 [Salinivibrio sp. AR647]